MNVSSFAEKNIFLRQWKSRVARISSETHPKINIVKTVSIKAFPFLG